MFLARSVASGLSNDQLRDAGPYVGESKRRPIPAFPGAACSAIVPFWVWGSKSST